MKRTDASLLSLSDDINAIRLAVMPVAVKYALRKVCLFGSMARGDGGENSDFDFITEGDGIKTLFDLASLRLDLEDAVGRPVDVIMSDNIDADFYDVIKDDEVLLYEA